MISNAVRMQWEQQVKDDTQSLTRCQENELSASPPRTWEWWPVNNVGFGSSSMTSKFRWEWHRDVDENGLAPYGVTAQIIGNNGIPSSCCHHIGSTPGSNGEVDNYRNCSVNVLKHGQMARLQGLGRLVIMPGDYKPAQNKNKNGEQRK